ncbi:hypothetical protein GCM10020000_08950 [Streptomyces olivoverticillatus]
MPTAEQPLTSEVVPGGPLRGGLNGRAAHEVASPRMTAGTFKVNFNASLLILHPDDVPGGTAPHPDSRRLVGCCGVVSQDGPNLVCSVCRVGVATKESDCWTDNLVALITAVTDESKVPWASGGSFWIGSCVMFCERSL